MHALAGGRNMCLLDPLGREQSLNVGLAYALVSIGTSIVAILVGFGKG